MMKFLVLLLASVAAVQSTSFSCPSYEYWCLHDFLVFPSQNYYECPISFKQCWLTTRFYSSCLNEFPKSEKDSCEAEKNNINEVIGIYEEKLKEKRNEIEKEINAGIIPFTEEIENLHSFYFNKLQTYLQKLFKVEQDEYKNKTSKYQEILDNKKFEAIQQFNNAVKDAMNKIVNFHQQIIDRFRNCLSTRKSRLESYNSNLNERSNDMINTYKQSLLESVTKRVEWAKSTFNALYGDDEKSETYEKAIEKHQEDLNNQVDILVEQYKNDIIQAVNKMKDNYRCNYKCYFQTGYYRFSQMSYFRSCVQFPRPPKYSYKLFAVQPFKVDWNGCEYSFLQTCEQKTPSFQSDTFIEDINQKAEKYQSDLSNKVSEWKNEISDWKSSAENFFDSKINQMIPTDHCNEYPTDEQVDSYHQKLKEQAFAWLDIKESKLIAQVQNLQKKILSRIESWTEDAKSYIEKVKGQFESCLLNRDEKISEYVKYIEQMKQTQQSRLNNRLTRCANLHKVQFDKFFNSTFDSKQEYTEMLRNHYKTHVDNQVLQVLEKFDKYWKLWQPKLVKHFASSFKCTTSVHTPCLNTCYDWNFYPPSLDECKLYV